MQAILESVKLARRFLLKKEIETQDVFSVDEARKFSPPLVEALSQAQGDEVVYFSVIHKRPLFILQNDLLTMGSLWAEADGIHIHFDKLFAKLEGDYQASTHTDRAIRNAKSLRVSLEAGPGQKLSYDHPMEIIVEPNTDFVVAPTVSTPTMEPTTPTVENKPAKTGKVAKTSSPRAETTPVATRSVAGASSVGQRLQNLENLRAQKLISEKEYTELRQKILSEI
jgi:hypothetical protein